jgi:hypothetical protein
MSIPGNYIRLTAHPVKRTLCLSATPKLAAAPPALIGNCHRAEIDVSVTPSALADKGKSGCG